MNAQSGWDRRFEPLWVTVAHAVRDAFSFHVVGHGYWMIDLLVTGAVLIPALSGFGQLRWSYLVYSWSSLLLPLIRPYPDRPLLSDPRFVLVVFPAFWVLASWTERRKLSKDLVVASFATMLGVPLVLFMNWYDIF